MAPDDFPELLSAAFLAARQTGKPDWHRMTTAVLKNRLLQMSEHRFDEKSFGAESFMELLSRFPELVAIDRTTRPTVVEWRTAGEASSAAPIVSTRVRADLWKAVLDYSSGQEYEWDPSAGQAKPVERADQSRRLPAVDRAGLTEWRRTFISNHSARLDEHESARLTEWADNGLGTQFLPRELQGEWNSFLKDKVSDLLLTWFRNKTFVTPTVTVPISSTPTESFSADLRSLVHQCVDAMSVEELRTLQLPAHVLLRVSRRN
jgi:hypothetical protein